MIFDEYLETIQHWRNIIPTSGWSDPVWTQIGTIQGRFEPIQGTETFLQNQSFADVTEILFTDIGNRLAILPGDGFVDVDSIQRQVAGQPEIWKHIMPHVVCRVKRTQWTVVS